MCKNKGLRSFTAPFCWLCINSDSCVLNAINFHSTRIGDFKSPVSCGRLAARFNLGYWKNALPPQWDCIQKQTFKVCSPDQEKFVLEFILVNIFSRENVWSLYILSVAHPFQALLYMGTNQSFAQKKNCLGHQMILAGCHPNTKFFIEISRKMMKALTFTSDITLMWCPAVLIFVVNPDHVTV